MFDDDMTLRDARALLRELVEKGHDCPCCTQFSKVYRRKLNHTIASGVIQLYRSAGMEYAHIPTVLGHQACEETKGWWWGLLEKQDGQRDDGSKRTGWWRVTELGRRFSLGQASIPQYARIYNSRVLGIEGDAITIHDALGEKFNYDDLMAGV